MLLGKAKKATYAVIGKLERTTGRRQADLIVKHQSAFIQNNMLPPIVGLPFKSIDTVSETIAKNAHREFSELEKDALLDYVEHQVFDVIKNPEATEFEQNLMFVRIGCLGYITDALVETMVDSGVVNMTPEFEAKSRSLTNALLNLLTDVQQRKIKSGKFGLSGSNHAEIREIVAMFKGLLEACYVSEYYSAHILVYYRLLTTRLGGTTKGFR